MLEQFVLSVIVDNHAGVLARVSSLFSRRNFNIDSLTVSATDFPEISRITIVVKGDAYTLDQITKQLLKLQEVKKVERLFPENSLFRELLLLKINAPVESRSPIKDAVEIYRAKILDMSPVTMIIELTGQQSKIDAFLEIMEPFGIVEMCRTGITAMERGMSTIYDPSTITD
ncbi:MAG: acetolactate synthase small subunit [Eubacteriales bacterium]|jgi:acetolactate synthase-1/3 small subunit